MRLVNALLKAFGMVGAGIATLLVCGIWPRAGDGGFVMWSLVGLGAVTFFVTLREDRPWLN